MTVFGWDVIICSTPWKWDILFLIVFLWICQLCTFLFTSSKVLRPGSFLYHTDQSGYHIGRPAYQSIPECELSQCYHLDPICATGEHHFPTPQPVPGPDVSAGKPQAVSIVPGTWFIIVLSLAKDLRESSFIYLLIWFFVCWGRNQGLYAW
jgi:hypothetical protein